MLVGLAIIDMLVAVWLVVTGVNQRRIVLATLGMVLVVCGITLWSLHGEKPTPPTREPSGLLV